MSVSAKVIVHWTSPAAMPHYNFPKNGTAILFNCTGFILALSFGPHHLSAVAPAIFPS